MVLKRKLPTDSPTPAGAPDAASQQEPVAQAAPKVSTPPPPVGFGDFDDIPEPAAAAEPRPMGGPASVAPAPVSVPEVTAQAAPMSSGGLKRRAPAPAAPAPTPAPAPQFTAPAPKKAAPAPEPAPMLDEDPLVSTFTSEIEPEPVFARAPEPMPMSGPATDDMSWMSAAPQPIETTIPGDSTADDDWEMGIEPAPSGFADPANDKDAIYGSLGTASDPFAVAPETPEKPANPQRPWEQNNGNVPPPTLPKSPLAGVGAGEGGSNSRIFITLGLLGVLGVGAYMFIGNRDSAVDAVSRWTGTLSNTTQNLPSQAGDSGTGMIQADEVINSKDVGIAANVQPPFGEKGPLDGVAGNLPAPVGLDGNTSVDFVDVPNAQKNDPIVADGSESMPEEVSAFASLHQAIMQKRAERDAKKSARKGETGTPMPPEVSKDAAPEPDRVRTNQEADRDLESYRRVLASIDNPADKPSPSEYFDNPSAYGGSGLLPPPGGASFPVEKPTKTPEGNPIIASEVERAAPEKTVRTLADFEDALMKQPERQVRIPSKVKPRLATSGFPELEILSLIPTYGLLANTGDRQGVLLIGDTFEGWELVGVYDTYAEFQSGDRKHVVTLK